MTIHVDETMHRYGVKILRYQMEDLALNTEEGYDKQYYSLASGMYTLNQRSLNVTSYFFGNDPKGQGTQEIETSQYLQEKKSIEMLLVSATENSTRQTESVIEI